MGQLSETGEFERYYATCFSMVAFDTLRSTPIADALIDAVDEQKETKSRGVAVFINLCYATATLCFLGRDCE